MAKPQTIKIEDDIAEAVRQACLAAALAAYEDAGINGLCHEGRWECAVDALRGIDVTAIIKRVAHDQNSRRLPSGSET